MNLLISMGSHHKIYASGEQFAEVGSINYDPGVQYIVILHAENICSFGKHNL